jgi:hypothetical protein
MALSYFVFWFILHRCLSFVGCTLSSRVGVGLGIKLCTALKLSLLNAKAIPLHAMKALGGEEV